MLPAIALLLSRSLGSRGRTLWAALLGLIAMGFVVDVLVSDHTALHTLEVPNAFRRAAESQPHVWIVDEVTAPVWQWHVTVAAFLGLAALFLFVRRGRASATPQPVVAAVGVSVFYLALRLALEKTAAPVEIVWAVGASPASFVILPFFAWHCGRRVYGFARFVKNLALMLLLQRLVIVVVAYFATTRSLGTHLDTHRVTEVALPGMSERVLTDPLEAWIWTMLIPQLTYFVVFGVVFGIVLGVLPWWLARRGARTAAAT